VSVSQFCPCTQLHPAFVSKGKGKKTRKKSNTARKKRKFQQYHEIVLILNE